MRVLMVAGLVGLVSGSASAAECSLAAQAEQFIAANSAAHPRITFISPIDADPDANALDTAYAVALHSDGYFGLIIQGPDGSCRAIDGAATALDDPVKWQTARKNIRAATGIN